MSYENLTPGQLARKRQEMVKELNVPLTIWPKIQVRDDSPR